MTRLILDRATSAKLSDLTEVSELCDESGRTLGVFSPQRAYDGVDSPLGDADLQRRLNAGGGRTLAEITADWDART